jgi:serine/threonine protein kinase
MAPEIHNLLKNPNVNYDMYKTDIFSLGVILFTIVMGRLPFEFATL